MTSSAEAIVTLRGVGRDYAGGVAALRGVDLDIHRGELVAIVGPSGSGKTTMLNVMGTLDRPSAGQIVIDGFDIAELSDRELSALRATRIVPVKTGMFAAGQVEVSGKGISEGVRVGVPK